MIGFAQGAQPRLAGAEADCAVRSCRRRSQPRRRPRLRVLSASSSPVGALDGSVLAENGEIRVGPAGVAEGTELLRFTPAECFKAADDLAFTHRLLREVASDPAGSLTTIPGPQSGIYASPLLVESRELEMALKGCTVYNIVQEMKSSLAEEKIKHAGNIPADTTDLEYAWASVVTWELAVPQTSVRREFGTILIPGMYSPVVAPLDANCAAEVLSSGFLGKNKHIALRALRALKPDEALQQQANDPAISSETPIEDFVERGVVRANFPVTVQFSITQMDPFCEDKLDVLETYASREDLMTYDAAQMTATFNISLTDVETVAAGQDTKLQVLVQFLRLLCLGASDAFLLEAVFRSETWEHMAEPVSRENEDLVIQTVVAEAEAALQEISEDSEESVNAGLRSCAAARAAEGRVWMAMARLFEREKNSLDTKEYYQERRLRELDLLRPVDESEIVDSETGRRAGQAFDEYW